MVEQSNSNASPGSPTILVVDDDPSMLLLCSKILGQEGFTVLQAIGSTEALKMCTDYAAPIHVLLIDVLLPPPVLQLATEKNPFPRVHGHQLVDRVLAIQKESRVILMSAHSDKELAAHGVDRRKFVFLRKPFTSEALVNTIREVLAGPPLVFDEKAKDKSEAQDKDIQWFD